MSTRPVGGTAEAAGAGPADARIMVVDDHPLIRVGLTQLIEAQEGMKVVAQAEGMSDTLRQLTSVRPDLVTIDLSLMNGAGLELIKHIGALDDSILMVVISMHDDVIFAKRALRAGAAGYVNKDEPPDRVIEAIRTALSGKVYLSPEMTERLLTGRWGRNFDVPLTPLEALSDRELEVFELTGRGHSTRAIAEVLHITVKTVETHKERIKSKLSLKGKDELLQVAFRWNLEQGSMEPGGEGEDEDADGEAAGTTGETAKRRAPKRPAGARKAAAEGRAAGKAVKAKKAAKPKG